MHICNTYVNTSVCMYIVRKITLPPNIPTIMIVIHYYVL